MIRMSNFLGTCTTRERRKKTKYYNKTGNRTRDMHSNFGLSVAAAAADGERRLYPGSLALTRLRVTARSVSAALGSRRKVELGT